METGISSRETDETAGDVETRISTEKNYEGREHVAQCTTKVRNSKNGAESEKTEIKNGNRTPKNLGKGPIRSDGPECIWREEMPNGDSKLLAVRGGASGVKLRRSLLRWNRDEEKNFFGGGGVRSRRRKSCRKTGKRGC
ncbi:hypothetical protein PIB30_029316 [Stylosanthes scabra]|uniref:Uncharacterized protein n=1 Tax=Stylosanthes scabra TaxID=79078 RepID=A0ABU6YD33_9FABA|nr:hypothetical protein [Stylosanthes scabra]